MRYLLFAILFLLAGRTTSAQQLPAAAPALAPVAPAALPADPGAVLLFNGWYLPSYQTGPAADTTGALLSLFRKRRYAGILYTLPFMAGLILALPISSTDSYGNRTVADKAISPPLGGALLGATVVGFILHASAYNKGHLRAIDDAYAAGRPIPAQYRTKLTQQHFAEAAYLREALAQQMQRERMQQPH